MQTEKMLPLGPAVPGGDVDDLIFADLEYMVSQR